MKTLLQSAKQIAPRLIACAMIILLAGVVLCPAAIASAHAQPACNDCPQHAPQPAKTCCNVDHPAALLQKQIPPQRPALLTAPQFHLVSLAVAPAMRVAITQHTASPPGLQQTPLRI